MTADLISIVQRFSGRRILLVGDFMLDRYLVGDAERISPEAPVPVLRVVERQDRAGGAGSVALNIAALGGVVQCFGLIGDDAEGRRLLELLSPPGVDAHGLVRASDRPTITKTRLVGLAEHRHRQQILRFDDEKTGALASGDARTLTESILGALGGVDIVCLEDYAKGVLSNELCATVIDAARRQGKPVLIDPARSRDWSKYAGATYITPNQNELEIPVGRALAREDIAPVAAGLVAALKLDGLIVTLGREGAMLVEKSGSSRHFPTQPRAVYDNTGAGDAVLAMAAVALASGASAAEAVALSNIAGGLEVSKFGCVPITRDEVLSELHRSGDAETRKIRALPDLESELLARRSRGETVVFTNGCFDILHPGHVRLLTAARGQGSLLVVGVNSDASVRALGKGDDRPIRKEKDRMAMLAALESVDYVTLFDDSTPARVIERIRPDVLIKGADWAGKEVVGQRFVESHGGRVVLIDLLAGYSTTTELTRIRSAGQIPT